MCVATTGRVISVDEEKKTVMVDYHGVTREAQSGLLSVSVGDEVLVHAGLVIQKLEMTEKEEEDALSDILREVGAF